MFGASLPCPENSLDHVCEAFIALGCEIRRAEGWRGPVTFLDAGALVYFLKAVPWAIRDFDVRRFQDVWRRCIASSWGVDRFGLVIRGFWLRW
jgi:hypothetical protein